MQSKKVVGTLKLTVERAELAGLQLKEFSQVFVQIKYSGMMFRTQSTPSTTNK